MKEKVINFLKKQVFDTSLLKRAIISSILYLVFFFLLNNGKLDAFVPYKKLFVGAFAVVSFIYSAFSAFLLKKDFHRNFSLTAMLLALVCFFHQLLVIFGIIN